MIESFSEKRAHHRVPLDTPLFVTVSVEEGVELPVQLVDCSRGGLQLAFSPVNEELWEMLNRTVLVVGLPRPIDPEQEGRIGYIAWISSGRFGVRFDMPLMLTEGEIREVASEL